MTKDTGLLSLAAIARMQSGSIDTEQLVARFANPDAPLSADELLRIGISLGFSVNRASLSVAKLDLSLLPAIGITKEGDFFTLLRLSNKGEALVYLPKHAQTKTISLDALAEIADSNWLLFRKNHSTEISKKFGLGWFVQALRRYKGLFAEVILLSFFLQLFALMTPLFFQLVMDKVLVHRGFTTLDVLAIGFLALALFDALMGTARNYLFSHTANRVDVELGAKLYRHLLTLAQSYFEKRQVGQSVARVRELETIRNFITGTALTLIVDLSFTLVFFAVMYLYSPTLTYVVAASIPLYLLLSLLITPVLRRRLDQSFQYAAANQSLLVESVSNIETLKALALENRFQRRWEEQLARYVKASFSAQNINNIANQSAGFISKLTTLGIIFFGAHLVIDGMLTVGELIAFNMLAGRVSAPILKIVQLWQEFQQAGISMQRLGDLLNTPSEATTSCSSHQTKSIGEIRFEQVCYRYNAEGSRSLDRISFTAEPGQKIGIVGRSGSGKSTLTKLLQRIYTPEAGRILLDRQDIAQADLNWLRRNVGVVLQESRLFEGSVRDNIAITRPVATQAEVMRAAEIAGAMSFIGDLPQGFDYQVGEAGCNLSGGQRQRIAIARALIANPSVLIMDEATSALDYESEAHIQRNLNTIGASCTLLIVAHRLASVCQCDKILVLEKGRIIDSGTHDELLARPGLYSRLWALQTNGVTDQSMEVSYAC